MLRRLISNFPGSLGSLRSSDLKNTPSSIQLPMIAFYPLIATEFEMLVFQFVTSEVMPLCAISAIYCRILEFATA